MHLYDYAPFLDCCLEMERQSETTNKRSRILKRKVDSILNPSVNQREEVPGDKQVSELMKTLDELGYERTPTQQAFHREFLGACLQSIYGSDFSRFRERILAEHNLDSAHTEVLVCTPRRFGKTTSVALFCAAMLWAVDEAWISVFSTGQRASSSLLDLTHKMIMSLPNGKSRVLKKNQEQLFLSPPDDPSGPPRRLFSYPSSVSGARPSFPLPFSLASSPPHKEHFYLEPMIELHRTSRLNPLFFNATESARGEEAARGKECAICLESLCEANKSLCVTGCSHIFHAQCLFQWLDTSSSSQCPVCRANVHEESLWGPGRDNGATIQTLDDQRVILNHQTNEPETSAFDSDTATRSLAQREDATRRLLSIHIIYVMLMTISGCTIAFIKSEPNWRLTTLLIVNSVHLLHNCLTMAFAIKSDGPCFTLSIVAVSFATYVISTGFTLFLFPRDYTGETLLLGRKSSPSPS